MDSNQLAVKLSEIASKLSSTYTAFNELNKLLTKLENISTPLIDPVLFKVGNTTFRLSNFVDMDSAGAVTTNVDSFEKFSLVFSDRNLYSLNTDTVLILGFNCMLEAGVTYALTFTDEGREFLIKTFPTYEEAFLIIDQAATRQRLRQLRHKGQQ